MSHSFDSEDRAILGALLKSTPVFAQLPDQAIALLASLANVVVLETGAILARKGAPGDALFLVQSGSLAVTAKQADGLPPLSLGIVKAGGVTGELSLLTGHPRAASIHAAEATSVVVLPKEAFDYLCAQLPMELAPSLAWMAERLHRYQIERAIQESRALLDLNREVRQELAASFQAVDLAAGQVLFREGEQGDALYLILSGRVRIEIAA